MDLKSIFLDFFEAFLSYFFIAFLCCLFFSSSLLELEELLLEAEA